MFIRCNSALSQARKIIRIRLEKYPWLILALFGTLSFTIFTVYSFERYLAFQTNFFDLGLDASSTWRTVNGYDSWASLILPSTPGHINHISPILGLVAFGYALVPDPRTLLLIQAAAVTLAAVPLYLLALRETGNQFLSIIVSGLYLANPALHGIIRFDFHPEAFIPLFVFLLYFSYPRQTPATFYVSLALLLSTIEYSAILGIGIAISLMILNKRIDRRNLVALLGSLMLLSVIIISTISGAFQRWNWPSNWLAVQFFGTTSSATTNPGQGIAGFLNNPRSLLMSLENNLPAKMTYLVVATAPMWFSLAKNVSRFIPAIPWIAVVIVTSRYSYSNVNFQYSAFLLPFVYLAAIPFLRRLMKRRKVIVALALVALSFTFLFSALSPTGLGWPATSSLAAQVDSINNSLPRNASILTEGDLFPQLSNKAYVTLNYSSTKPPEYILVNFDSPWYNWTNPALGYPLSPREQTERFLSQYHYDLIVQDQGLHLYKLETTSPSSAPAPDPMG